MSFPPNLFVPRERVNQSSFVLVIHCENKCLFISRRNVHVVYGWCSYGTIMVFIACIWSCFGIILEFTLSPPTPAPFFLPSTDSGCGVSRPNSQIDVVDLRVSRTDSVGKKSAMSDGGKKSSSKQTTITEGVSLCPRNWVCPCNYGKLLLSW